MLSYKEFSKGLNSLAEKDKTRKLLFIEKITFYFFACWFVAILEAMAKSAKKKNEFNKKYKTVIKENWLGFKSHEYHER